jgi:hypothetical protein
MPVGDPFVSAWVQLRGGLAGEEDRNHDGEEEHIGGQCGEDERANAHQKLSRAVALKVVVTAAIVAAAGGPPESRGVATDGRILPPLLGFSRFARDGGVHTKPL